jgi:hypothetical protein
VGVLSQLRVAAARPELAGPRPARPSETGQAVAVSALLMMGCLAASGPLVYLRCRRLGATHWSVMAATTRELAVGLVLPVYAFLIRRRMDLFAGVALTTAVAAAVSYRPVVAAVLQGGVVALGGVTLGSMHYAYDHRVANGHAWPWVASTFAMSLGCLWVLAGAASGARAIRRLAWWLVPVAGMFLLGYDWPRLPVRHG